MQPMILFIVMTFVVLCREGRLNVDFRSNVVLGNSCRVSVITLGSRLILRQLKLVVCIGLYRLLVL